ncbi:hypothetical protein FF80_03351 [Devosia sp. LC5]|uniref:DUF6950 family protein n=1 Tax=Devosia sp. LC5 TaxID=1502724 RepID=UPI0004E2B489|nr:hypothetical protein [Devosia sp. LC5]KFC62784.1 hypothetical protein FF80_03351 [Devosia sp. LC5]
MTKTRFEIVKAVIDAEMASPYAYGTADCFFFGCRVADALDASLDLAKTYAGSYKTLRGAQMALRRRGHKSLIGLFAGHLTPCGPAEARIGDIGIMLLADGEHVGVCVGSKFITKTWRGRSFLDLADCKAAFRVG